MFGLGLHLIYGGGHPILAESISWFNIVGNGYVKLLQMVVMPLVFVSILGAVAKLHQASSLGKISFIQLVLYSYNTDCCTGRGIRY